MKRGLLAWLIPLALIGCQPNSGETVPVYQSADQYQSGVNQARALSKEHLEAYQRGEELSESAKADLVRAEQIFEGLIVYNPTNYGPFVGAGKIARALGDNKTARERLSQALKIIQARENDSDDNQKLTAAECYFDIASIDIETGNLEEAGSLASLALALFPKNPDYLALKASVLIQQKQVTEATRFLREAQSLAPNHRRTLQLLELIKQREAEK